jgi:hypothetical protein
MHQQVQRGLLLQHGGDNMHCLRRWSLLHSHWHLQLHAVRLRSLPAQHRPDILQLRVPTRKVLKHRRLGMHVLPHREVRVNDWRMQLQQLLLRPLPAQHRPIVLHRDVPSWQVLRYRGISLHQLPSWSVRVIYGNMYVFDVCRWAVPDTDRTDNVLVLRMWNVQHQHRAHHYV